MAVQSVKTIRTWTLVLETDLFLSKFLLDMYICILFSVVVLLKLYYVFGIRDLIFNPVVPSTSSETLDKQFMFSDLQFFCILSIFQMLFHILHVDIFFFLTKSLSDEYEYIKIKQQKLNPFQLSIIYACAVHTHNTHTPTNPPIHQEGGGIQSSVSQSVFPRYLSSIVITFW